jgi:hypothetical protein
VGVIVSIRLYVGIAPDIRGAHVPGRLYRATSAWTQNKGRECASKGADHAIHAEPPTPDDGPADSSDGVAGPGQWITEVTTVFDGFSIGDDSLSPGTTQYDRTFEGQSANSGASHNLVVTAFDQNNSPESATKIWTDVI